VGFPAKNNTESQFQVPYLIPQHKVQNLADVPKDPRICSTYQVPALNSDLILINQQKFLDQMIDDINGAHENRVKGNQSPTKTAHPVLKIFQKIPTFQLPPPAASQGDTKLVRKYAKFAETSYCNPLNLLNAMEYDRCAR
jgi:hypothetical protein